MLTLRTLLYHDRGGQILLVSLAVLAILIPFFNLVVPESSPLHIPTYTVTLLG